MDQQTLLTFQADLCTIMLTAEAYKAANAERKHCGEALAYHEEAFQALADDASRLGEFLRAHR